LATVEIAYEVGRCHMPKSSSFHHRHENAKDSRLVILFRDEDLWLPVTSAVNSMSGCTLVLEHCFDRSQ